MTLLFCLVGALFCLALTLWVWQLEAPQERPEAAPGVSRPRLRLVERRPAPYDHEQEGATP